MHFNALNALTIIHNKTSIFWYDFYKNDLQKICILMEIHEYCSSMNASYKYSVKEYN